MADNPSYVTDTHSLFTKDAEMRDAKVVETVW